ncbi:hypothetical protein A2755_02735 [Candidatus Wolfebacteria bacterium RIFCSPHIGHO2_01_FULL_48_22]|uniref:Uncharacterized protein n=2 Tax=Candidatus Wolfeibacteriota TaxID=1752735 RepID=A0A1F8DTY7_9BACT|nr:MAG: hypothetical protein A2755_02735 [Candidatus Wolfebacteria bacterium RIFCSPHIGHO2_01_FULL_48_22]OGM92213.1 MAG: hypothetical protein A2935_00330 [Candidatus Wolfebacteria bacterium RIFCSPLOWO2_01_FULL_47_17b]
MLTYILEVVFFLSAGAVLYLLISKLPLVEGMVGDEEFSRKKPLLQEKMTMLADEKFIAGSLKVLRRVRLMILKVDNLIARRLDTMKAKVEEQQKSEEKEHILKEATEEEQKDKGNG